MTLTLSTILRRSLLHRRARSFSALIALTVSAAVATALLTLYADLDTKLHKEFRSFGANILITAPASNLSNGHTTAQPSPDELGPPQSPTPEARVPTRAHPPIPKRLLPARRQTPMQEGVITASDRPPTPEGHSFSRANIQPAEGATALPKASLSSSLSTNAIIPELIARAQQAAGPDALIAPFAYAVATTDRNTPVVVAGTDFPAIRKLDAWWQVVQWPTSPNAALLGQRAANFIANEQAVTLTFNNKPLTLQGAGRLKTGGDEDSRIYVPLATFTAWTGTQPTVLEIQVPGGAAKVSAALGRLRQAFPNLQIQPVRQLVEGESRIVDRTHALMYAAVLLIALTVAVSVVATLSASVLERRRDFALMKALGSSQLQLLTLFLLETLLLALGGVASGFLLGSAAAFLISEANFHTSSLPHLQVLPVVLLLNLLIATLAALFPAQVLRGLQPAALLKGE